jgi:hypothetical protein
MKPRRHGPSLAYLYWLRLNPLQATPGFRVLPSSNLKAQSHIERARSGKTHITRGSDIVAAKDDWRGKSET